MRYLLPIMTLVLPLSAFANTTTEKQWFNSAQYANEQRDNALSGYKSFNQMNFASTYYFAPQQSTGVWDDYGYLDTDSKVSVNYTDSDRDNFFGVSGEAFFNNWFVNAEVNDLSDEDSHSIGFGYLYNDNLKVSVKNVRNEGRSDDVWVEAAYNHQINESDYLGFTARVQDSPDDWSISGRYFKKLDAGQYFTIDASHDDYAHSRGSVTRIMANYYMTENWAFGIGANDSNLELGATFFLSDTYYYKASFINADNGDVASISFHANL
ncbi:hypothetical protein PA25_33660 [Pseudoalteromonas sp. A25]|uniref:putative porin n=1 Tax=Pseudoalteromonas sp. A25 TaxID=116092 RepID=UPI00126078CB|nr:putative porin [Pseudoalteromonas sp. A25]BBN83381.1 hypothetical protein PA25_33660 [Pseudoalteromonas sp. A25]